MSLSEANREQLVRVARAIAESARNLIGNTDFQNALPGQVEAGRSKVVLERLSELAACSCWREPRACSGRPVERSIARRYEFRFV